MSLTSDIRRVQRRAEGGRMAFLLDESGAKFRALIYPTRGEASDMVAERLKAEKVGSVALDEFTRLVDLELAKPLYEASGSTLEEALSLLGKEVAEDAKSQGD